MIDLKSCLIALAVGLLVGAFYGLLNVRSPAPPVVALIGLLGILLGEQLGSAAAHLLSGSSVRAASIAADLKGPAAEVIPVGPSLTDVKAESTTAERSPKNPP